MKARSATMARPVFIHASLCFRGCLPWQEREPHWSLLLWPGLCLSMPHCVSEGVCLHRRESLTDLCYYGQACVYLCLIVFQRVFALTGERASLISATMARPVFIHASLCFRRVFALTGERASLISATMARPVFIYASLCFRGCLPWQEREPHWSDETTFIHTICNKNRPLRQTA